MIYPYNQCFYIVLVQDVNFNENILEKNNYSQNYTKDICKFLKTSILCNASVEQETISSFDVPMWKRYGETISS